MKHLLIISATSFEVAGLQQYLQTTATQNADGSFQLKQLKISMHCTGIGLVATTFHLTQLLLSTRPDMVLQLGIAGVLEPHIPLGTMVWVKEDLIADLGARDAEGLFLSLEAIGLSDSSAGLLHSHPLPGFIPHVSKLPKALGLSVNQITGNAADVKQYAQTGTYDCHIESMEGAALHYVCGELHIPCLQLRSISNYIEPRDKSRWQMKTAIDNLNSFACTLLENIS